MKLSRNPFSEEQEDYQTPHFYISMAVICFFLLLLLRLWYLQIVRGYEYRRLSENNRTRIQDILPPRGLILDRHGEILVENYPSFELAIIREDIQDKTALLSRLAYLINRPLTEVQERFEKIKSKPAFKPALMYSDLIREEVVALETNRFELPGVVVQVKPSRRYRNEQLASHVVGYLNEVTKDQLNQAEYFDHRVGDLAGQIGVERIYEQKLHGRRGQRVVEVNASGRVLKVIRKIDPLPGDMLYMTIDAHLQEATQKALADKAGAAVVLDLSNGEILAIASTPSFNQNDFVHGIDPDKWQELLHNPFHPLENRAVSGQYPPGSTYKIIAAAAALEEGVVTPKTLISCSGSFKLGDRVFHCWNKYGHGRTNIHRALMESCDVYFYKVSLKLGVDKLSKYARAFGLGRKSGSGLVSEKPGLVPSKAWKRKKYKKSWQKGETLNVVIGQGYNLATPLQMAVATAAAVNGGLVFRPHLVKKIVSPDGGTLEVLKPEVVNRLNFKPETFKAIKDGLVAVVNGPRGTGKKARMKKIVIGGKTGTSQVVTMEKFKNFKKKDLPYKYRDHAWFVAFAPAEDPQIALAVIVEHAGHGGTEAVPVAKEIIKAFFTKEKKMSPGELTSTEKKTEKGD